MKMFVRKCDICGRVYEEYGDENRAHISMWSDEDRLKEHPTYDACPDCTRKIELVIDIMKRGDDFSLHVYPNENMEET